MELTVSAVVYAKKLERRADLLGRMSGIKRNVRVHEDQETGP
jgi:hypothetical protein